MQKQKDHRKSPLQRDEIFCLQLKCIDYIRRFMFRLAIQTPEFAMFYQVEKLQPHVIKNQLTQKRRQKDANFNKRKMLNN